MEKAMEQELDCTGANLDSDDIFLLNLEQEMQFKIPETLRNILKVMGLCNNIALDNFEESQITEIENFIKNEVCNIIDKSEIQKYVGPIYKNHPEKFKFVIGHKNILLAIIKHHQKRKLKPSFCKQRNDFGNSQTNSLTKNRAKNVSTDVSTVDRAINLTQQNKALCILINKYLKETFEKESRDDVKKKIVEFRNGLKHYDYNSFLEGDSPACNIECPRCKNTIKVKQIQKSNKFFWIASNFYTHVQKHLNSDDKSKVRPTKKKKISLEVSQNQKSSQKSITSFCIPPGIPRYSQNKDIVNPSKSLPNEPTPGTSGTTYGIKRKVEEPAMLFKKRPHPIPSSNSESDTEPSPERSYRKTASSPEINEEITINSSDSSESEPENTQSSITLGSESHNSMSMDREKLGEKIASKATNIVDNNDNTSLSPRLSPSSTDCIIDCSSAKSYQIKEPEKKSEKWKQKKYSRTSRTRRSRENISEKSQKSQELISKYCEPVNRIAKLIEENKNLREMLLSQVNLNTEDKNRDKSQEGNSEEDNRVSCSVSYLIKTLYKTAIDNSKKKSKQSNRYDGDLKKLCTYLFLVGGKLLYETLYANLQNSVPSITTIRRSLEDEFIEEGVLRINELAKFLKKRGLPNVIWISEDGTKITPKIEYDPKTNKIVGFVIPLKDGMPLKKHFLATSAAKIQSYFHSENKSDYAYVMMAQCPVDKSPPFCLGLFGTDNRFTYQDVLDRWKFIETECKKYNISVLGYSSDGDTRLMKAMRLTTLLGHNSNIWEWFHVSFERKMCVQDTVHIGTKLRVRFLKIDQPLQMGEYIATPEHLKDVIQNHSKSLHFLTESDLSLDDKMNFEAVEKICKENVRELLNKGPDENLGTIMYLKIISYVLEAFLSKNLSVNQRIHYMWYSVFFLRIWRQWLKKENGLSSTKNFISANAYLCIEINAHALINLVRLYRSNITFQGVDFTPWLFSSQPCEQIFRATRSMTSTFSTIVNFSLLGIMNRLAKIEKLTSIINDLKNTHIFPREQSSRQGRGIQAKPTFPTDEEIDNICTNALKEVLEDQKRLGIDSTNKSHLNIALFGTQSDYFQGETREDNIENEEANEDLSFFSGGFSISINEESVANQLNFETNWALSRLDQGLNEESNNDEEGLEDSSNIVPEEILSFDYKISLKDYQNADVSENSPYVLLKLGEKVSTVKKSTLCWLFTDKISRISSDRLQRFRNHGSISLIPHTQEIEQEIIPEKYYAVYYTEQWYVGRILEIEGVMCTVKFLHASLNTFVWPKRDDIAKVEKKYLFYGPLNMVGISPMAILENDRQAIVGKYKDLKKKENALEKNTN